MIKKVICKDRLSNEKAHEFATRECAVHSNMDHDNIVKLFDYTETEEDYLLYMEFCDKADYLPAKILEVSALNLYQLQRNLIIVYK